MDPSKYMPSDRFDSKYMTTNYGAPVWNNNNSLTLGASSPILLEDYHLVEKLANFDRERIPERVVHAVGASAKGYFECTHDITHLTCADVFRGPGTKTPLITRFSTVVHSRGSPETLRDPRGFAVKFYTREGNWDLVGNNMPVFFIRDGIAFPDMVHAFKPNPVTGIQDFNRVLDFLSFHPESCHMLTFLLDDVGIPQDYRHMDGFGVHTFRLLTREGKETLVKFHWKPSVGVKSLLDDEAVIVGGKNHAHAQADLFESIAAGNFPEWKLFIQCMDPADQEKFEFDPLDVTKTWPEDRFPLMEVGRMVLNQNIDNFFAENEMLAFSPGLVVPGIYYSDDKLLQSRIFSYSDTQRYRLGPNYLLLPVNAPRSAYHNNHHDGAMNFTQRHSEINYMSSRFDKTVVAEKYPLPSGEVRGKREKTTIAKENNFAQAGARFRSFDPARQERFVRRWVEALSCSNLKPEIRKIWLGYWAACDRDLGARIARGLKA